MTGREGDQERAESPGAASGPGPDSGLRPDAASEPEPDDMATPPQALVGWLPRPAAALFGEGATAEEAYGLLTVDVLPERWIEALTVARDELGCDYFDWLSAVDEPGTGFRVCAHLVALPAPPGRSRDGGAGTAGPMRRLVLRTTVGHEAPALPTATGLFAGAGWHERETHEMFGLDFTGHPHLVPLLLPDEFEGHPLRKDFVLAARVAKAWPGAKEPGESGHGGPKRRQMQPPGVPDPNEWGPLKGRLPAAPARAARPARGRAAGGTGTGAGAGAGTAGERPARRTRTAGGGSASQRPGAEGTGEAEATTPEPSRRSRSADGGSASQRTPSAEGSPDGPDTGSAAGTAPGDGRTAARKAPGAPRRSRSAGEGSASQRAQPVEGQDEAPDAPADASDPGPGPGSAGSGTGTGQGSTSRRTPTRSAPGARSTDAPWHHASPDTGAAPSGDPGADAHTTSGTPRRSHSAGSAGSADEGPASRRELRSADEPADEPAESTDESQGPELGESAPGAGATDPSAGAPDAEPADSDSGSPQDRTPQDRTPQDDTPPDDPREGGD